MDGTITVALADTSYTDCVAATDCNPGGGVFPVDVLAQWRFSAVAVPVPAALWLFGSALGLLSWMRRKAS
jgi:hypothetical protein